MCFEVPTLVPPGGVPNGNRSDDDANDDDLGIMDIDENDSKAGNFFLICFSSLFVSVMYVTGFCLSWIDFML